MSMFAAAWGVKEYLGSRNLETLWFSARNRPASGRLFVDFGVEYLYFIPRGNITMGHFGVTELLIILGILLLIFGPSRLGDLGSSLGKGIKGFRKSMKDDEIDVTPSKDDSRKLQDHGLETPPSSSETKKNA